MVVHRHAHQVALIALVGFLGSSVGLILSEGYRRMFWWSMAVCGLFLITIALLGIYWKFQEDLAAAEATLQKKLEDIK